MLQGRVACEINSGDELVATEVIFAGVLSELEPEEAVALLSALVVQVTREGSSLNIHNFFPEVCSEHTIQLSTC